LAIVAFGEKWLGTFARFLQKQGLGIKGWHKIVKTECLAKWLFCSTQTRKPQKVAF
jgi:hypothetical protein